MSEFIVKYPGLPKYAVISESNVLKWSADAAGATGFPGQKEALEAFRAAQRAAEDEARRKLASALAAKRQIKDGCAFDYEQRKYVPNMRAPEINDYRTVWGQAHFTPDFEARASQDDLRGTFEICYARSPKGWLGFPSKKTSWSKYSWNASFHQALPFMSREAAELAIRESGYGGEFAILLSTCAFTEVSRFERCGKAGCHSSDDTVNALATAVEARDIQSAIKEAALLRAKEADDLQAGRAQPEQKKGPRL